MKLLLLQNALQLLAVTICAGDFVVPSSDQTTTKENAMTIKSIMRLAMTKGLVKKVVKQEATVDEQKELVQLFVAMKTLTPPKGTLSNWDRLNSELIQLAIEVRDGKPSHQKLAEAVNCVRCHQEHRSK